MVVRRCQLLSLGKACLNDRNGGANLPGSFRAVSGPSALGCRCADGRPFFSRPLSVNTSGVVSPSANQGPGELISATTNTMMPSRRARSLETVPCSIWQSTANFAAATWSRSRFVTWLPDGRLGLGRSSFSKRRGAGPVRDHQRSHGKPSGLAREAWRYGRGRCLPKPDRSHIP